MGHFQLCTTVPEGTWIEFHLVTPRMPRTMFTSSVNVIFCVLFAASCGLHPSPQEKETWEDAQGGWHACNEAVKTWTSKKKPHVLIFLKSLLLEHPKAGNELQNHRTLSANYSHLSHSSHSSSPSPSLPSSNKGVPPWRAGNPTITNYKNH